MSLTGLSYSCRGRSVDLRSENQLNDLRCETLFKFGGENWSSYRFQDAPQFNEGGGGGTDETRDHTCRRRGGRAKNRASR